MTTKFNNISEEKQRNIINAAINEFGSKDFDNASTDTIAENAKIAKGSLFYYFGNKKKLYLFIVEYCTKIFKDEILDEAEKIQSKDFYERIKEISIIKQNTMIKYPMHSKIITDAFVNMPVKVKDELQNFSLKYYTENTKFMEEYIIKYINEDLLSPLVKKEDAIFITMTLFDALTKKYTSLYKDRAEELLKNKDKLFEEFDKYIDIIKHGIYK